MINERDLADNSVPSFLFSEIITYYMVNNLFFQFITKLLKIPRWEYEKKNTHQKLRFTFFYEVMS